MDWTKSVFESETWQLGELAAASCALADASFVPFHTRLLRLWDLDHEVNQGATIKRIIRRHGLRSEVEELLFVQCVEEPGQGYFLELEDAADLLESKMRRPFASTIAQENRVGHLHEKPRVSTHRMEEVSFEEIRSPPKDYRSRIFRSIKDVEAARCCGADPCRPRRGCQPDAVVRLRLYRHRTGWTPVPVVNAEPSQARSVRGCTTPPNPRRATCSRSDSGGPARMTASSAAARARPGGACTRRRR